MLKEDRAQERLTSFFRKCQGIKIRPANGVKANNLY